MTKSTSERSSILVLEVSRPRAASASSCDSLPFPTSFARSFSANLRPLSIEDCELSIRLTGTLALCAATRAIPRPWECQLGFLGSSDTPTIWPAPMTPSFLTSAAALTEGVELKPRHCSLMEDRATCLEAAENILYSSGIDVNAQVQVEQHVNGYNSAPAVRLKRLTEAQ
jgi:hypothetical protein